MSASNYWRLKTSRFEAVADTVLEINASSPPNEINIMVEAGTVEVSGDTDAPNNIFGAIIGESAIIVSAGQSYALNEQQYKAVTITIKSGAIVQLSANI